MWIIRFSWEQKTHFNTANFFFSRYQVSFVEMNDYYNRMELVKVAEDCKLPLWTHLSREKSLDGKDGFWWYIPSLRFILTRKCIVWWRVICELTFFLDSVRSIKLIVILHWTTLLLSIFICGLLISAAWEWSSTTGRADSLGLTWLFLLWLRQAFFHISFSPPNS